MSQASDFAIVIPARYASQRLPGKLLADIAGRTLLEHAWQRATESAASEILIATDDDRIREAAEGFGADVQMTSARHLTGSDRIAQCVAERGWPGDRVIVNLQGDEPLMPPDCLDQVAGLLAAHPGTDVATLYALIESAEEVADPNVVKVVARHDGQALLFSRAVVPLARDHPTYREALKAGIRWRRHLGLYAYRCSALDWFSRTPATPLESAEKLEQLRFLECGRRIVVARARRSIPRGVDTPEDLDRVRALLE